MINKINGFLDNNIPYFQKNILPSLNNQQKKVTLIVLAVIACVIISYAVITKLNVTLSSIASNEEVSFKKEPVGYCLLWIASLFMTKDPFIFPDG